MYHIVFVERAECGENKLLTSTSLAGPSGVDTVPTYTLYYVPMCRTAVSYDISGAPGAKAQGSPGVSCLPMAYTFVTLGDSTLQGAAEYQQLTQPPGSYSAERGNCNGDFQFRAVSLSVSHDTLSINATCPLSPCPKTPASSVVPDGI